MVGAQPNQRCRKGPQEFTLQLMTMRKANMCMLPPSWSLYGQDSPKREHYNWGSLSGRFRQQLDFAYRLQDDVTNSPSVSTHLTRPGHIPVSNLLPCSLLFEMHNWKLHEITDADVFTMMLYTRGSVRVHNITATPSYDMTS